MDESFTSTIDETQRRRFESAWKSGRPESIEQFLPPVEDARFRATLLELVLIEIEFRWKRYQHVFTAATADATTLDRPALLEAYFERFPQLQQPDIVLQLIQQEYLVRHQHGDRPGRDEYAHRFPAVIRTGEELQELQSEHGVAVADTTTKLTPGQQFDRYQLRERHGVGGFGEVWRADDPKLGREIAVKLLKERLALHGDHRRRFENEARIAARLEHPGIVPVYELGQAHAADPYYTMKLVRGETFAQAIRRFHEQVGPHRANPLEQLKLLSAFLTVARTMEYAHARGVIHRDLKPQNIILGDYGETIILDWGLAKSIHDDADSEEPGSASSELPGDSEATQLGTVKGTPAYMAPEQAAGDVDRVNERTDIYALGAILYQLLTGRLPFEGSKTDEILRRIIHEHPQPPRAVDPHIAPALEAICQKAMAKQPQDRYSSASELTRDLEHYLADEPVSAFAEPWTSRVRRWTARHRTQVTTAVAVVLVALVGLSVATVLLARAKQVARRHAREASDQRDEANKQRGVAEENFRLALGAVNKYFTQVSEDPRLKNEGLEKLREDLLKAAGEYYEKFVEQSPDEPRLKAEQARANWRLAAITDLIGSKPEAIEFNKRALSIFQELVAQDPENSEYQTGSALTQGNLANQFSKLGNFAEAETIHRSALATWEQLVERHPAEWAIHKGMAMSYADLGGLYMTFGRLDDAETALDKAAGMLERLIDENNEPAELKYAVGQVYSTRGNLAARQHHLTNAETAFQDAFDVFQRLAGEHPQNHEYRQEEAKALNNLGITARRAGDMEKARTRFEQSLARWRELADKHPDVTSFQDELALTLNNLGALQLVLLQFEEADVALHEALLIRQRLVVLHPSVSRHRNELLRVQMNLAVLLSQSDHPEVALPMYRETVNGWASLADEFPDVIEYWSNTAGAYQLLASAYLNQDMVDKAEDAYRAALKIRQVLVHDHPEMPEYRNLLAVNHSSLGLLFKHIQNYPEAITAFRGAIQIWESLREQANDSSHLAEETDSLQIIGEIYHEQGSLREAQTSFERVVSILERHRFDFPDESLNDRLSKVHWHQARVLALMSQTDGIENREECASLAVRHLENAIDSSTPDRRRLTGLSLDHPDFSSLRERIDFHRLRDHTKHLPRD